MNIARGLFRFWILLSVGWVVVIGFVFFEKIADPYLSEKNYIVPDQNMSVYLYDGYYVGLETEKTHTKIEFPNNVYVYAHSSVGKDQLNKWAPSFAREYVQPREKERSGKRWENLAAALGLGVGVPIGFLMLGLALGWVFAGFRKSAAA